MELETLRYPVGKYRFSPDVDRKTLNAWIDNLDAFPQRLAALVDGLSDAQLESRYRQGGWTIRQVVHHLVDSHLNSYVRFKWALTEDNPTIKTYHEAQWAELNDARTAPIQISLEFISGLHKRWVFMLRGLTDADFERTFFHPEYSRFLERSIRVRRY